MSMKAKSLFGLCAALAVVAVPLSASAQTAVEVDGPKLKYNDLPHIPVLPKKFVFPILTEMVSDPSITTNSPIADQYPPPPIPDRVTLDDLPGIRAEYTTVLNTWYEEVRECLQQKPKLIRVATGEPIHFEGKEGTIVLNANDRPVCVN